MKDEFANRQAANHTLLGVLVEYKAVWENQRPIRFTAHAVALRPEIAGLQTLIAKQEAELAGHAERKQREEDELEDVAHEIGEVLSDYFVEIGREDDAAQIDLSLSAWQALRDESLIAKAQLLLGHLDTALEADAATLDDYDLTPEDAAQLKKELEDYEQIVAAPSTGIAERKARTAALRPAFRKTTNRLLSMDKLVLRFRKTEAGRAFAAAWKNARIIRDLGSNSGQAAAQPTQPDQ